MTRILLKLSCLIAVSIVSFAGRAEAQQSQCARLFQADTTIMAALVSYFSSRNDTARIDDWSRAAVDEILQPVVTDFGDCDAQTQRLNYLTTGLFDTFALASGREAETKANLDKALSEICLCNFSGASQPQEFVDEVTSYGVSYDMFAWVARRLYSLYRTSHIALTPTTTEDAFLRYWVPGYSGSQ